MNKLSYDGTPTKKKNPFAKWVDPLNWLSLSLPVAAVFSLVIFSILNNKGPLMSNKASTEVKQTTAVTEYVKKSAKGQDIIIPASQQPNQQPASQGGTQSQQPQQSGSTSTQDSKK